MADLTCGAGGSTGSEIVTQINANTAAIADLDPSIDVYEFVANADILDVSDSYTPIVSLVIPILLTGNYLVGFSSTFKFDTPNASAMAQMILNSGTPEEFFSEPKSTDNRQSTTYIFPYTQDVEGAFSLAIEMKKTSPSNVLDVLFANMWIDKKSELVTPPAP